jgi:L-amino acid N-acyltransferase YncA
MSYQFETMCKGHRTSVIGIFNYFVEYSFAAYPETRVAPEFFDRLLELVRGYSGLVVKSEAGEVVGFGLLRPYHPFDTFRRSAEVSYFLLPEHTRKGIGSALLQRFITTARSLGVDRLLAEVSSLNEQSLAFHQRNGFSECGRLPDVGRKFGRSFDVVWFVRSI